MVCVDRHRPNSALTNASRRVYVCSVATCHTLDCPCHIKTFCTQFRLHTLLTAVHLIAKCIHAYVLWSYAAQSAHRVHTQAHTHTQTPRHTTLRCCLALSRYVCSDRSGYKTPAQNYTSFFFTIFRYVFFSGWFRSP